MEWVREDLYSVEVGERGSAQMKEMWGSDQERKRVFEQYLSFVGYGAKCVSF